MEVTRKSAPVGRTLAFKLKGLGSSDFLVFQVGLCTFCYIEEDKKYEAKPFNFYVFPKPYSRAAPDCRFLCQNKQCIPFITSTQESELRDLMEERHKQYKQFSSPAFVTPDSGAEAVTTKGPINVPEEHKDFIEGICKSVEEFLEKDGEENLSLPPCNGFVRKLIYQTVRQRFQSGVHLGAKTDEKKQRYIQVTRIKTEDEMKMKEQEKQSAELAELEEAVGFTKVIRLISQSNYQEFKAMAKCVFPKILDTKLMANTAPCKDLLPSSVLGDLLNHINCKPFKPPEIVIPENFPQYKLDDSNLHEAAYDAYITGICFTAMSNFLGGLQNPPLPNVLPDATIIKPFTNKLFLMRISDIPYLDLAGDDVLPSRDHVFHVTFPKEWKAPDLYQLFSPFVMSTLCKRDTRYKIMTYELFKNGLPDKESRKRPHSAESMEEEPKKKKPLNVESITPPMPEENENKEEEPDSTSEQSSEQKLFEVPAW
uniref:Poly(A)-specific ribonuclease PARN n=1 Tax=Magallana gigas TaxID=29159 RepID=K1R7D7_MAGGI